ncbi:hypothetical protein [Streptomyces sp. ME19-01-6]|uniref:hypothetical protein n=1 Tax=Streptomyces sp. ME19-01-6 TaxID=3028686 RepID=UPI0029A28496|nr:hypothetical protein [Streptomyces sp. ME19-01-6]MDX3228396.1 hypothetical protein [Streptomyces sp. ME19-01-6]
MDGRQNRVLVGSRDLPEEPSNGRHQPDATPGIDDWTPQRNAGAVEPHRVFGQDG